MNETKLICPCCGAEFQIPEKEHVCVGVALAEDSNAGTVKMPLKKDGKARTAEERLGPLKAAGIDTSGLFALKGAAGEDLMIRMKDGVPSVVTDDDPVFKSILESGTLPEQRLFRRWVMAQTFRYLTGDTKPARKKGSDYMWKMTVEEFRVQALMERNCDKESLAERQMWFNKKLAVKMARWWQFTYLEKLTPVQVKNVRYLGLKIEDSWDTESLYKAVKEFADYVTNGTLPKPLIETRKYANRANNKVAMPAQKTSEYWYSAYQAAGAYFTLKNLILFHGITYSGSKGEKAAHKLLQKSQFLAERGHSHAMYGILLDTLKANGITREVMIAKRIEWHSARQAKKNTAVQA